LVFLAFWTVFLLFYLLEATGPNAIYRRDNPESLGNLGEPAYWFYAIAFLVLALFLLSDGVTKERESGMFPLVGAKPIRRANVLLAKLAAGGVVYVASFAVSLLPLLILAVTIGAPVLEMMALLYLGPFLALYAFLLGFGLLVGVASSSSKVAIGSAAGIYLPLFMMMRDGPMQLLYQSYPAAGVVASYTPFNVAHDATQVIVTGGQMPWGGLVATFLAGAALCGAAFWLFSRQEVAK
ncbi:MAG TPA: ABC transporter permease subunit, partial [Candidatus Thermoplasmatota archaeon]|nr:ABC transporter permease subunit [Candidatus Thermoplasmatota archaeon]